MLNKMKARLLIGLGGLAVTSFIVMMGYTIGSQSVTNHTQKQIQSEAQKLLTKEKEKEKASVLSDELVKEFLTQYYTKEKLGENNNRIKPYMTDSAFKEEVARQEDSINQVYKDYMLDYRFESANIYVNTEENEAFAEVSYQVVYVSDVSDKAQKSTQTETRTLWIGYTKLDRIYKVFYTKEKRRTDMSRKIRRYFTDDFKQQIVDLHNAGRKRSELIKEYDLTPSTFDKWVKH